VLHSLATVELIGTANQTKYAWIINAAKNPSNKTTRNNTITPPIFSSGSEKQATQQAINVVKNKRPTDALTDPISAKANKRSQFS